MILALYASFIDDTSSTVGAESIFLFPKIENFWKFLKKVKYLGKKRFVSTKNRSDLSVIKHNLQNFLIPKIFFQT